MAVECVLDASAVLALLRRERGHERIKVLLPVAAVSTVNYSEVLTVLIRTGASLEQALRIIGALALAVLPFLEEEAVAAARLVEVTRRAGLSFGDRACLATAQVYNVRAVTAERVWRITGLGVNVELIR